TMEPIGKEVIVDEKSRKRGRSRKMEAKPKYAPENWIDEGRLALEFSAIRDKIYELGASYIFNELERHNLTLVREFYANWDTSFKESTKIKIRGQ
ncbi:hypothetical protein HAX54_035475, partial [Datura stramonium]|nr:hypothetical protein [Datura stramonium]